MEDIKKGITAAGFKQDKKFFTQWVTESVELSIEEEDGIFSFFAEVNGETAVGGYEFETLEELNKLCYGYLLEDLDFDPKKTYQWKEHFDQLPTVEHNGFLSLMQGLNAMVSIPAEQKLSIVAGLKLRVIVDAINADFPNVDNYTYFPVLAQKRYSNFGRDCSRKLNSLGCESREGLSKLWETNLQLLNQYFGIKTETT